ncbi:hypothetical protein GCM10028805_61280 [Spirosoma harenae]
MGYTWDYLYSTAYNNRTGRYKSRKQLQFILDNLNDNSTDILDVAGGSGRFAIPLLNYSNTITVIDINENAIEILKSRSQKINVVCNDFLNEKFNNKYSSIICIEAVCYFEDIKFFFKKIHSLLNEDGKIVFTYTNTSSWRYFMRRVKGWVSDESSYSDVSINELKSILADCQLEIDAMEGMNWIPLPLTSNSILVDFFVLIEEKLNLKRWKSQSPWLLISAKKKNT